MQIRGNSTAYNNRNVGKNLQSVNRDGAKVDLNSEATPDELNEQRKYKLEL